MRIVHAMPEIDVKQPAAEPKPKRKRPDIPAMHPEKAPHSKYTNAEVVALILLNLRGAPEVKIAARTGLPLTTVRNWCNGSNRRRCYLEAMRVHRESLGDNEK